MEKIITKKILLIIVVIVVIGWFAMSSFNTPADTISTETVSETATSTNTVTKVTTPVKKTVAPVASQPVSMSYQKALEIYKDNKRIQISGADFCQASPNNVMYKNGTSIMIDNRSSQTRTIKIDGTYTIEGYGFRIIKLSSGTLPATFLMDCNKQQNIAKILLQK